LLDIGVDVHAQLVDRNRNEDVACYIPFSNKDKIKITARQIPDPNLWDNPDEAEIYVVVQGTPEMIHNYCNVTFNSDCQDEDFSGADKKQSLKRVDDMAKKGLVPVSYGYKKMTMKELSFHMEKKDVESEEFKEDLLTDLTYLCTFGLENPLRLKVHEDVSLIKYGMKDLEKSQAEGGLTTSGYGEMQKSGKKTRKQNMVNVRMITGDHFETARFVAHEAGIISRIEKDGKDVVMTGQQFRDRIGFIEEGG
jgi:magnesium-transporting ATPase (P-type)